MRALDQRIHSMPQQGSLLRIRLAERAHGLPGQARQ
jgi:hypothetical protein